MLAHGNAAATQRLNRLTGMVSINLGPEWGRNLGLKARRELTGAAPFGFVKP